MSKTRRLRKCVFTLAPDVTASNQCNSFTTGYTEISMRSHASSIRANLVSIINLVNGYEQSGGVWTPNKALSHKLASLIFYTLISLSLSEGHRLQSTFDALNGL